MTYDFSPAVSQMIAQQLASGSYQSVDDLIGTALQSLHMAGTTKTRLSWIQPGQALSQAELQNEVHARLQTLATATELSIDELITELNQR
jgi:Arc/MetJ-type ribon-helix-helix transcriptional regulator